MPSDLPKITGSAGAFPTGWQRIPLAETGIWMSGGTPSTSNEDYWGGDIPWISAASLKSFVIDDSDRRVTDLGAASGTRVVPEGVVLFVIRGMSLNKEFRVGVTGRSVAFGQDCKAISPSDGVDPTFLATALVARSANILRMVETTSHGTGRLDMKRLGSLDIGLPTLDEQRHIIKAVTTVDNQIQSFERQISKVKTTKEAAIEHILSQIKDVDYTPVGLIGSIRSGKQLSPISTAYGKQFPYLRVANVMDGFIDTSNIKKMHLTESEREKLALRPGDILLNEGQSVELVGRSSIFNGFNEPIYFQNTLIRFRPADIITSEYAQIIFSQWLKTGKFSRIAKQTTSIAHLGADRFAKMAFPVAPKTSQELVAATARKFEYRAEVFKAQVAKLRTIRQALVEDLITGRVRVSEL